MLEVAPFGGVQVMAQFTTLESASHQRYPFTHTKKMKPTRPEKLCPVLKRGCLWPENRLKSDIVSFQVYDGR